MLSCITFLIKAYFPKVRTNNNKLFAKSEGFSEVFDEFVKIDSYVFVIWLSVVYGYYLQQKCFQTSFIVIQSRIDLHH